MDNRKDIAKSRLEEYLKLQGIDTRKNFTCLNPEHPDKNPSMGYRDNRVKCFSCGASYDIFDIVGIKYGITETAEKFRKTYAELGLSNANDSEYSKTEKPKESKEGKVYTTLYKEWNANLDKTDYLDLRGISKETAKKYNVGYNPMYESIIFPMSPSNYSIRNIGENIEKGKRYIKQGSGRWVFNSSALRNSERPVFITEGEIDALSIIEAGGEAVAISSIDNVKSSLLPLIDEIKPKCHLIIALDNDDPGRKATDKLEAELAERGFISFHRVEMPNGYKDPNEALVNDREEFIEWVSYAQYKEKYDIYNNATGRHINGFLKSIQAKKDNPPTKTGFESLDNILGGGIYPGLYFIGAMSSLGKTTFVLQVADNVAQFEKRDVLIFSLEMARYELMAKSISRLTYIEAGAKGINTSNAKTTRGIMDGSGWGGFNPTEARLVSSCFDEYSKFANRIYISEGIGNIGVSHIRSEVENHISFTGNKPIVIIDYLQLLAPYNERYSDKQNVDKNVLELKRISRDFDIPVIGISSMNRESYKSTSANKGEVSIADFKESGAIEYSADVLIGLQFTRAGESEYSEKVEKGQEAREIKLVVLKNRNYKPWVYTEFMFHSKFNFFEEV